MEPQAFSDLTPKVVLGIAAHPDDLDFSASGTLATFAARGAQVYYLQITDGCKGSADPTISCGELTQMRQEEQRSACRAIGGTDVFFLNYTDGELEVTLDLKKDLVRYIRKLRPDVVMTTDPSKLYYRDTGMINHSDHRAAGQATLDSVYPLARDHLSFPEFADEGLTPHKVSTVLLTTFSDANFYVDITQHLDQKVAAIRSHASQLSNPDNFVSMLTQMAAKNGEQNGYDYAEGFIRLEMMS